MLKNSGSAGLMKRAIDAKKDFSELESQFHRVVAEATHNKHCCDFIQFLFHRIRTSLAFEMPEISKNRRIAGKILRDMKKFMRLSGWAIPTRPGGRPGIISCALQAVLASGVCRDGRRAE